MKQYIAKNWKHMLAALLVIILQALYGSHIISLQQDVLISGVLSALGFGSTTNSGTNTPTPPADATNQPAH
jgi:hypothetical protein